MRKSGISGAEKASDPPLLAMDDGDLDSSMPRAGAIISGGVTSDGKAAIQALDVVGNINVGFELEDKIQAEIEEYYLKPGIVSGNFPAGVGDDALTSSDRLMQGRF